jgi:hypothetical protein
MNTNQHEILLFSDVIYKIYWMIGGSRRGETGDSMLSEPGFTPDATANPPICEAVGIQFNFHHISRNGLRRDRRGAAAQEIAGGHANNDPCRKMNHRAADRRSALVVRFVIGKTGRRNEYFQTGFTRFTGFLSCRSRYSIRLRSGQVE